jgi:hypothetical protein
LRPDEACDLLSTLLPVLKDPVGKRDTLRRLAGHLAAKAPPDLRGAEGALREALKLHERHQPDDPLTRADLASALADVLQRQDRGPDAASWQAQAARAYQAVLRGYPGGRRRVAEALAAFWKLQMLYRRTSRYKQALNLTADRPDRGEGRLARQAGWRGPDVRAGREVRSPVGSWPRGPPGAGPAVPLRPRTVSPWPR